MRVRPSSLAWREVNSVADGPETGGRMDKEALKRRMRERFEASLDEAVAAVERAPEGRWIADSEWVVRETFQKLMADCFRDASQAKADAHPAASRAAFSPSGPTR